MPEELRQCLKYKGNTGVFFLCLELSGLLCFSVMGLHKPHLLLLGHQGGTGLDVAGSGSLWENPQGDPKSAQPFIPTYQKD